jgi:acyl-coenzyme A thioesterase PaaI-like protein
MSGPARPDPVPAGHRFAAATAVQPEVPAPGAERPGPAPTWWSGTVEPGWDIAGNANGGYLLAICARAMSAALGRPDPVTVTGHYLAPGKPGPVRVGVEVVKQGRTFGTATAGLVAGGRPLLQALGTFGELSEPGGASGPELVDHEPPSMPAPDECAEVVATDTFPPPFMGQVELRLHPDDANFLSGSPSGRPLMRGWFRLRDGEPVDTLALLCAVDAFPPTVFNAHLPVAWTPTVELTAHVRARPEPGWLRCRFATHFVTGGFLEADGEIWDGADRLVAQSRQLALVPRNPPPSSS